MKNTKKYFAIILAMLLVAVMVIIPASAVSGDREKVAEDTQKVNSTSVIKDIENKSDSEIISGDIQEVNAPPQEKSDAAAKAACIENATNSTQSDNESANEVISGVSDKLYDTMSNINCDKESISTVVNSVSQQLGDKLDNLNITDKTELINGICDKINATIIGLNRNDGSISTQIKDMLCNSDKLNSIINDICQGSTTTPDNNNNQTQKPESDNNNQVQQPESNDNNQVQKPDNNTNGNADVSAFEKEVADLVNQIRLENGLSALTLNAELSNVARVKSQDMHDKSYFSHTSPTYGSPFDMMKQFGIKYSTAGENIAKGHTTPQAVVDGWMNSQGHRENILNPSFTQIGVGYVSSGNYWTQMFIG